MKKVKSVALFMRTHLFTPGVDKNEKVLSNNLFDVAEESVLHYELVEYKKSSLKTSRRFKIALISSYAFLISLFGVIVYTAILLDPKFPF